MIHTIFFDIGGTLVDADDIFQLIGNKLNSPESADFMRNRFMEIYNGGKFMKVKDIIAVAMKEASEKFSVEDLSENAGEIYKDVLVAELEKLRIVKYFDNILVSSEIKAYKPSDKVVNKALEICEEPLSDILIIGDSDVDIEVASKMGIKSVLIVREDNKKINKDPDFKISTLNDIFDILES
jgi:FMN phosphatase YigB (HAD superfamily)